MVRRAVAAACATSVVFGVPGAEPARAEEVFVQPGEYVRTETGKCTLSFIFDGSGVWAGRVFVSTAAHCVASGVGERAWLGDGTLIGRVVAFGSPSNEVDDWAFVEVRPAMAGRVRAWVKGYPSMPTGHTTSAETSIGDMVHASGNAAGADTVDITRENRSGVLSFDSASRAGVVAPIWWGDSGGPLLHAKSGKALAVVSRLCAGDVCESVNPTIEGILAKAAARGFTATLRPA